MLRVCHDSLKHEGIVGIVTKLLRVESLNRNLSGEVHRSLCEIQLARLAFISPSGANERSMPKCCCAISKLKRESALEISSQPQPKYACEAGRNSRILPYCDTIGTPLLGRRQTALFLH